MHRLGVLTLLATATLIAQSPTATITGIARDAQGAVIPGVQLTATSIATQQKVVHTTNDGGLFSLRQLPIGQYVVEAEKAGFRRFVRRGLVLTTGQNLELDIQLEVGAVSESITVSGSATMLETRTSDVAQLVEAKAVEDLPLGDRRILLRPAEAAVKARERQPRLFHEIAQTGQGFAGMHEHQFLFVRVAPQEFEQRQLLAAGPDGGPARRQRLPARVFWAARRKARHRCRRSRWRGSGGHQQAMQGEAVAPGPAFATVRAAPTVSP